MAHFPRSSGILLHPTSLPGRYGIGDLGEYAYRFVDYLATAHQTLWQVLPLGPTSYGDSPYQSLSAFAGNPNLISLDKLVGDGWLTHEDVQDVPDFPAHMVDFGPVIEYHRRILSIAFNRFQGTADDTARAKFKAWCAGNADWLDEFALFAALKDANEGHAWSEWPSDLALHREAAVAQARVDLALTIEEHQFKQWIFFSQWSELKLYANDHGVRLIGDIPIFVAADSADVWGNQRLFYLDEHGVPTVIAGVPPDYFSTTGQRWGNPLYRWDVMAQDNYGWWISRFKAMLKVVDIIRIDHFRGFEAYWEVPGDEETAVNGKWIAGPRDAFFDVVQRELGDLPIIAEDLGVITPGVEALRDKYNLPGMKVLQFAWGTPETGDDPFLPHNHVSNGVIYTGTHDNNTTRGWWQTGEASPEQKRAVTRYIGHEVEHPHWDLIRMGMASVAHTFLMPLQDVLGFGADTRMNTPGRSSGNWSWRFTPEWLEHKSHERLTKWTLWFDRSGIVREKTANDLA